MIVLVLASILYLLWTLEAFWCGRILQHHTKLFSFTPLAMGAILFFALFECFMLPVVFFHLSTKIAFVLLLVELLIIPGYCIFKGISLFPKKEDGLKLGILLVFVGIFGFLFYRQTIGIEVFDSSYYMSRVLENSVSATFGGVDYKTGVQLTGLLTTYDYQGFYYFFSLVLKGIRPFLKLEIPVSIYLWLASFIYFGFLGGLLMDLVQVFKKSWKTYLSLIFVLPYLVNYYNTALPFIGNTYRTLAIACFVWMIYLYRKEKDEKALALSSVCFVAGFSFSSSFLFLGAFAYIGLFFSLVLGKEKDLSVYFHYLLAVAPLAVFAALFAYGSEFLSTNLFAYIILGVYAFVLLGIYLFSKKAKEKTIEVLLKGFTGLFLLAFLALVILSFLGKDGNFGYGFYFENAAQWDMVLSPFDYTSGPAIIRNGCLAISILAAFIQKKEPDFLCILVVVFILFGNPLVEPFVAQHLTNLVYARTFEIFINPFTLFFFGMALLEWLKKPMLGLIPCLALGWVTYYSLTNVYNYVFIPDKGYDAINKVEKEDVLIANYLNADIEESELYRPSFISQTLSTKALVPNGISLISKDDLGGAPAYSDGSQHSDNDVLVLFYPYEYYDQVVWAEKPDYANSCSVITNYQITYVVMRKDVVAKLPSGEYVNAWFYLRDCTTLELETDNYVVLKRN